jgi:hypothetical protein
MLTHVSKAKAVAKQRHRISPKPSDARRPTDATTRLWSADERVRRFSSPKFLFEDFPRQSRVCFPFRKLHYLAF